MELLLADIYMIWGVPVTFLFLLCTAPGLVSAASGCSMNYLSKASRVWGQIQPRLLSAAGRALSVNQLCLKPRPLAQQEERLGGEGSDARSAGFGLGAGRDQPLLPLPLSLGHFVTG